VNLLHLFRIRNGLQDSIYVKSRCCHCDSYELQSSETRSTRTPSLIILVGTRLQPRPANQSAGHDGCNFESRTFKMSPDHLEINYKVHAGPQPLCSVSKSHTTSPWARVQTIMSTQGANHHVHPRQGRLRGDRSSTFISHGHKHAASGIPMPHV
jgi:hypothetical protein